MLRYALSRLLLSIAVLLAVTLVVFLLTETIDPAASFGRRTPLHYGLWLWHLLRGDLGTSLQTGAPVVRLLADGIPVTMVLVAAALLLSLGVALPLALLGALYPGSWLDRLTLGVALTARALPSVWTGVMLALIFAVTLGWLPLAGVATWRGYVLPAASLALLTMPVLLRIIRAALLDVLASEHAFAARARGLRGRDVLLRHTWRNVRAPLFAAGAAQLGYLLGSSIVAEQIFGLPGVGYLAWEAVLAGDVAVIQAVLLLLAGGYILLVLAADLLNAALDPPRVAI